MSQQERSEVKRRIGPDRRRGSYNARRFVNRRVALSDRRQNLEDRRADISLKVE